jgi:hypothetical protein
MSFKQTPAKPIKGTDSESSSAAFVACFCVFGLPHPSHRTANVILLLFFKVVTNTVDGSFHFLPLMGY